MENDKQCVTECNVEVKSELDDPADELKETGTFREIGTEPSTSNAVQCDKNTLPYYSFNHKIEGKELEIPSEQNYDEKDKFCLESDQVALNSNNDYQKLLQGIYLLERQRVQTIKALDELYKLQEQALFDPDAFLEKLQKHNVSFPASSKVHELPVTDWSKYELNFSAYVIRKQQTKLAAKISDLIKSAGEGGRTDIDNLLHQKVRRPKRQYNPWTDEEHKRLEELLIQFPPEEVEARRWEKIANCLENRTPAQVFSRVQKYFIRLLRHGIQIPGKRPGHVHNKKNRRNVIRDSPSTFLVSHHPPVYMPDGESDFSNSCSQPASMEGNSMESKMDVPDEEDIKPELKNLPECQELKLLKENQRSSAVFAHIGFKCSRCNMEPIMGTRWHCTDCKTQSIDFCPDCCHSEYEFDEHRSDHHLEAIQQARTSLSDRENTHFMDSDNNNYMDPNYMPAM